MHRALFSTVLVLVATAQHAEAVCTAGDGAVLQRFFSLDSPIVTQYRALRHLEARNNRFDRMAWMDVWTEGDPAGFRYEIVRTGGSRYIQRRVFLAALDTERDVWTTRASTDRSAFTRQNYTFESCSAEAGLTRVAVRPRRKDMLLVEGTMFLRPEDGELVRVQGTLSKAPSFWTSRVDVVRTYARVAGVRVPVAFETVASVVVAGQSTFQMTYAYESVNGRTAAAHPSIGDR